MNNDQHVVVYAESWYDGLVPHIQAIRHYSPGTRIHLLHDQIALDQLEAAGVHVEEQSSIEKYRSSYDDFLSRYVWSGTNSYEGVCRCYRRHYVLLDYAKTVGLKSFWYFDWDVLVFCDLKKKALLFSDSKGLRRGGNFYVNDIEFFEKYLESWKVHPLISSSEQPNCEQFIELSLFSDTDISRYYVDAYRILSDGTYFDGNLCSMDSGFLVVEGKAVEDSMKMLLFREEGGKRYPYAYHTVYHRWVRLNSLHCWGSHKSKMAIYLSLATAP